MKFELCNKFDYEKEINFDCEKISEEIKNQSWYPYDQKNDPTIQSMLVMIEKKKKVNKMKKLKINKKKKNIKIQKKYKMTRKKWRNFFKDLRKN